MFIENKYTMWYHTLIKNAKARELPIDIYVEKHHIIPRSLGGTNVSENLVNLTAREHFICHLLLTKMLIGRNKSKMIFALSMLVKVKNIGKGRYIPNSRLYEYARHSFKAALAEYWTAENRKIHADKISKVTKGRKVSDATKQKLKNKVWTEAAKESRLQNCLKAAAERKGKCWSENRKLAFTNTPYTHTEDHKKYMSSLHKGKQLSSGRRVGHWFISPDNISILFCPLKTVAEELSLSLFRLKKLIKNPKYEYCGWRYSRLATSTEIKSTIK